MMGLTQQEHAVYYAIIDSQTQRGRVPTYDEIKDMVGLKSKSGVQRVLNQLAAKGLIRRLPNKARANKMTGARELFEQAREAYNILSDPQKRALFDETGGTDPLPDIDLVAINAVRGALEWAVSEFDKAGVLQNVDIIATAREKLRGDIAGFVHAEIKSTALAARYAKLRRQVRGKYIERIAEQRCRAARNSARIAAHNVKVAQRAIELLADHEHTP